MEGIIKVRARKGCEGCVYDDGLHGECPLTYEGYLECSANSEYEEVFVYGEEE